MRDSEERLALALRASHEGVWTGTWKTDAVCIPPMEGDAGLTPESESTAQQHSSGTFCIPTTGRHSTMRWDAVLRGNANTRWNSLAPLRMAATSTSSRAESPSGAIPLAPSSASWDPLRSHRAQARREQSERLYRAIGDPSSTVYGGARPNGRNTYASESFLKLVGMTQQQCSDFGMGEVLHPDDADRTITAWQECSAREGLGHRARFRGVDGQWHAVLARGVPVRDEQDRSRAWAGITSTSVR